MAIANERLTDIPHNNTTMMLSGGLTSATSTEGSHRHSQQLRNWSQRSRSVAIPPDCNHNVRATRSKGHANLVEEHHRPALATLLPAAGPDATDQCRCDLLRGFEKVLRIWFCFEPF